MPLVADAGDSPFVGSGQKAGCSAPPGRNAPGLVPVVVTRRLVRQRQRRRHGAPGHDRRRAGHVHADLHRPLTRIGASSTDTVKTVVAAVATQTLLDQTKADPVPVNIGGGNPTLTNYLDFPFQVPAGLTSLKVVATWGLIANDYDLHVIDPTGAEAQGGYSGNGATNQVFQIEAAGAGNPMPGTWTVRMERYLTVTDTVHVVVTGTTLSPDPRPVVRAGGPYRFEIGAGPALSTARSPAGPARSPRVGPRRRRRLRVVRHRRHANSRRAAPRRRSRRPTPTASSDARRPRSSSRTRRGSPRTPPRSRSIGIADSGINPYHLEFSAATYPDPDVLPSTTTSPAIRRSTSPAIRPTRGAADHARPGLLPAAGRRRSGRRRRHRGQPPLLDPRHEDHRRRRQPTPPPAPRRPTTRTRSSTTTATAPARRRCRPATATATARPACWSSSRDSTRRIATELAVDRHHLAQLRLRRRRARSARSPARRDRPSSRRARPDRPVRRRQRRRQRVRRARSRRTARTRPAPTGTSPSAPSAATTSAASSATASRSHISRLGRRQPAVGVPHRHRRPVRLRRHLGGDAVHRRHLRHRPDRGPRRDRRRAGRAAPGPGRRQGHGDRRRASTSPTAS